MKKITYALSAFILSASLLNAAPIKPTKAKLVAKNFYTQNSGKEITSFSLAYTGLTKDGKPAYFAFNVNANDGFVIVSGDDNASPIIGYSTQNNFVTPEATSTIGHWLAIRTKEIENIRVTNTLPTAEVALTWMKYESNNPFVMQRRVNSSNSTMSVAVAPLVQSTWNQSPNYNAQCPGGSVTGCVATAMAQIMRFWSYPAVGTGSSSYCDCSSSGFSNNYGTQTANYGATTYNWANMPLSVTSANADVAKFNYQCGVSVEMDYDPAGSGAWVITTDDPICAQNSYVQYFGYDPTTIQGLNRYNYDDTTWTDLLKNDINIGRPIQYVGDDPAEGGHTWVCDGYDQNDFFHMNWGWGGSNNGFFFIDNLQTTNGTFNPSVGHEAIIGIVPMSAYVTDASISAIMAPVGYYCTTNFSPVIKLQNFGSDALTSCNIYYKIDNGA
ncbi:MAG: C10 family peptidase, partial [Bacteroidia bacterium]